MTETQKLRNVMFDEIDRIKRGDADLDESLAIVKLGNNIIQSYNTELKAIETMVNVQHSGANVPDVTFIENKDN